MATNFDGAALPVPDPEILDATSRGPRNFLATSERRRLFWALMPTAVMVVVALELVVRPMFEPPLVPPEKQIDTRFEVVAGPPPPVDAVVITPSEEKIETDDTALLGASPEALAKVRDATFFGSADLEAWLDMFLTLQGESTRPIPPSQAVGFTELFNQPRSFRGRAVRIRGTLRRLEKVDGHADEYGVKHYWQGWLEPEGGPASPVVVHCLRLPEGMAVGLDIREPATITGFFLKNMAYVAGDGLRLAPLIVSLEPLRPKRSLPDDGAGGFWNRSIGLLGVGTMLAIVSIIGFGYFAVGMGRRRRLETEHLDPSIFDADLFSVSESLKNLAAADAKSDESQAGGVKSE